MNNDVNKVVNDMKVRKSTRDQKKERNSFSSVYAMAKEITVRESKADVGG